ncbi:hypothetical protein [Parasphingorhabdus sp.]|uniref:hypothetical protein n=1 Tax=Parasphingorhabdus sp. TaxID=2709688 RepID=UPI003A8E92CE
MIGEELSEHLKNLGFDSFDHVFTEEDAVAIADMRKPDLVLVGDNIEAGDSIEAARRISQKHEIPMLLVTSDSFHIKQRMTEGAILEGPFAFSKIPEAFQVATEYLHQEIGH